MIALTALIKLNPQWPVIAALAVTVGVLYRLFVDWALHHNRYGWFWRANVWLAVVIGNLLVAGFTAWTLQSWHVFVALLVINMALGGPQIVGALWDFARVLQAQREDRDAQDQTRR